MSHLKNINKTLALATTVLLEACSSAGSGTTSGPEAVVNVKAPELIGTWETGCVATSLSGSSTVTQASGSGGSGSISGGEAYKITAVFYQEGHVDSPLKDMQHQTVIQTLCPVPVLTALFISSVKLILPMTAAR